MYVLFKSLMTSQSTYDKDQFTIEKSVDNLEVQRFILICVLRPKLLFFVKKINRKSLDNRFRKEKNLHFGRVPFIQMSLVVFCGNMS